MLVLCCYPPQQHMSAPVFLLGRSLRLLGMRRSGRMGNFDRDGQEITRERWIELFADRVYVRIGATELRAGTDPEVRVVVSTVWTGIDTGNMDIFETRVEQDGRHVETARYSTEGAAKDGHNELVGKHIFAADLPGPRLVREIPAEET